MPTEWYLMQRPLFNSGFEDDEFSAFSQDGFEEVLDSFLADDIEIFDKRLTANPVISRAVIQGVTSDTYNNSVIRQFLCRIGTLRSGQYVKARDQIWMIYSMPDNNKVYEKAVGWQCKHSIRFVSPISGEIVEYPVYDINSTQYGSGETDRTYISVGSANHLVYIPYNEETIQIDSGFRFLIDKNKKNPTAYRLAQVDPISYSCGENDGIIQWTIVESQFDEKTDNKELMVADYYGKSDFSKPDDSDTGIHVDLKYDGFENEVIFGEDAKVNISFFENGQVADIVPLKISIMDGTEYGSLSEIGDDYFVVHILDNREYIGQEITISVRNTDYDINEQITLKIKGWY